jgi:hypothetical protein
VKARHGHKLRARTFAGYSSHFSVDPDEELITNVAVIPANNANPEVIDELLTEPAPDTPRGRNRNWRRHARPHRIGAGELAADTGATAVATRRRR